MVKVIHVYDEQSIFPSYFPKWDNKHSQLFEFIPARSPVFFSKLFWLELLECFGLVKFMVAKATDF